MHLFSRENLTKEKRNICLTLLVTLLALIVFGFAVNKIYNFMQSAEDYQLMVVLSGSMSPVFNTGDVIVVSSKKNGVVYKKGDIITFKDTLKPERLITHRITEVQKNKEHVWYWTKGDANDRADYLPVPAPNVVGCYKMRVPYCGKIIQFCKNERWLLWVTLFIGVSFILYGLVNLGKYYSTLEINRCPERNNS